MILIKNGKIIDPKNNKIFEGDILTEGDKIKKIGRVNEDDFPDAYLIDASDLYVAPGLTDIHVHFRDPGFTYKEDICSGARAAAAGGFTRVVCMANTSPCIDNVSVLSDLKKREKDLPIHIENTANVTLNMAGKEMTDFDALKAAGAAGFTDDGVPIMDEKLLFSALKKAKELDVPISLHEEDPAFIERAGYNETAPEIAEEIMISRDLTINRYVGAKLNIQHLSGKNSVSVIRAFKKQGVRAFCEVTPQHFTLTEESVKNKGALSKINPPLRKEEDRLALIEALKDDTIDFIVTDHAPHAKEEKEGDMYLAKSGMIGLEISLSLSITSLFIPGHMDLISIIKKMTYAPSKFYGFDGGFLYENGPADIVIFDPKEEYTVSEDSFFGKSKNSPFIGEKLFGKVKYTICNGKEIFKDENCG